MNNNRGFTLIELIIATTIILIVSLGFFGWASTIIQTNLSIERNNTAYAMLMEVAEELQRMYDNSLIQPRSGSSRCVGFDGSGDLKGCDTDTTRPVTCSGSPQVGLSPTTGTNLTILTNPRLDSSTPYLYDNNACATTTWDTDACRTGSTITTGANAAIDHPNATTATYDSINPIRSYKNTTYYAVWSVAYMPCGTSYSTDRRKIFVTVYWIDPEPADTDLTALPGRIAAGTATVKSVSIVVDKAIGTES
ncbi:MAG: prepilin-type N-terminal cleavage/methylation domain-containing protein [Nitrospirota bacterium]|nr:prepilin-type N-terminal cleavage/methylation domain-containing protein [Nitrospirota bacterium]